MTPSCGGLLGLKRKTIVFAHVDCKDGRNFRRRPMKGGNGKKRNGHGRGQDRSKGSGRRKKKKVFYRRRGTKISPLMNVQAGPIGGKGGKDPKTSHLKRKPRQTPVERERARKKQRRL